MTSTTTASPGVSTATNLPLSYAPTQLWEGLAAAVPAARMSDSGRASIANLSTGKLATAIAKRPGAQQSVEQVKASATAFVDRCWKDYASKYPEAFKLRGSLPAGTPPKLVFVKTQTEFDKIFGSSDDTADMVAFVKSDDPTKVYVHTANLAKYSNKFGPNYVKAIMSHELVHNLTLPLIDRVNNDSTGKKASYRGVQNDLQSTFYFDPAKSPGIKKIVSVGVLIKEFAAEHYAAMATGLQSYSVSYAPVRATGDKLLEMVGESTFRKAVLANDPVAYRRVVEAAKVLQGQNVKAKFLNDLAKDITEMRAAQAAAPLGAPLTPALLEKLVTRCLRESSLHSELMDKFPEQVKNFDFRLMSAVDANFKSRGRVYDADLGDASSRELTAAIKAVWPSLK